MRRDADFTTGKITGPLLKFAFPVFLAMLLQSMYGAVDLLIVGRFGESVDVSAVSTGSQITMTLTTLIAGFSMGTTIILGQLIGEGNRERGGAVMGASIFLFGAVAVLMSAAVPIFARPLAVLMNAPAESLNETVQYIRICGFGFFVIIAYNLIGSIFRGIGDSSTPLITVAIACTCNIAGDLLLCAVFRMGTRGAAYATVFAQLISVAMSFLIIRRRELPFSFSASSIRFDGKIIGQVIKLGFPIALQDLLVGISFLVILAIVNSLGLVESAAIGVSEKVCGFIMLVPSAFSQAMAAFVAQNIGANRYDRAKKALAYSILTSSAVAVVMFYMAFFHGTFLSGLFSKDAVVAAASAEYLKAYAIDCLLTCFLFCFIGFFNGIGMTAFVMVQGIVGAFGVRVPVSFLMSREVPVSLFHVGLATPCSTLLQIILCFIMLYVANRRYGRGERKHVTV